MKNFATIEEDDIFYNEGESLALDSIEKDYISEDEFHLENDNEADDSNSYVGPNSDFNSDIECNSDFSDSYDEHIARQPLRLRRLAIHRNENPVKPTKNK